MSKKQLINKILAPIDYLAIFIGIISCILLSLAILGAILEALLNVWKYLQIHWSNNIEDRFFLIIILLSFVWCTIRWRYLKKPSSA